MKKFNFVAFFLMLITLGFVMTSCSKDDEPLNGGGGSDSGAKYTYVSTSQSLPSDVRRSCRVFVQ